MVVRRLVPALFALGVLAACSPEDPPAEPPGPGTDASCDESRAAWIAAAPPAPTDATEVLLDSTLVRDAVTSEQPFYADGDTGTAGVIEVGASLVLRLDGAPFLSAMRYTPVPGQPGITDFTVYVSNSPECWGTPIAVGAFDGTDAIQEVVLGPDPVRFIRIDVDGATGGIGSAAIADLGFLVGGVFASRADENGIVGVRYEYVADADLPGRAPLEFELTEAPAGMALEGDGVLGWTPTAGQEGPNPVTVVARRGPARIEQSFTITVAGRRSVGSTSTPDGGGTVTVSDPMGQTPDAEITTPSGTPAGTVEIFAVEGATAEAPSETTPLGVPFVFESDLPEGTEISVRFALDGYDIAPDERVYLTELRIDEPLHDHLFSGLKKWVVRTFGDPGSIEVILASGGVYQLTKGKSVQLEIGEFQIDYMLDPMQDSGEVEARLARLANNLMLSRDRFVERGCTWRDAQLVVVRELNPGVARDDRYRLYGQVVGADHLLELDKGALEEFDETTWRSTVAHEMMHVFQFVVTEAEDMYVADAFFMEGQAVFASDDVFDDDIFGTKWNPYDQWVTGQGLTVWDKPSSHHYKLNSFWKALAAQGEFNYCDFLNQYGVRDSARAGRQGIETLSSYLGGDDPRLEAYTRFVSAWNHVRSEAELEDADVFFSAGQGAFTTAVTGTRGMDGIEYLWREWMGNDPGGLTGEFKIDQPGSLTLEVREPAQDFHARVYDAEHDLLMEIRPGDGVIELEVEGAIFVDLAVRQDGNVAWGGMTNDLEVVAILEAEPICGMEEASCSGSGEPFDMECCEGSICVVGICQANVGARERTPCMTGDDCATGLRCGRTSAGDGSRTCCARDAQYCETTADCCGFMECSGNRCAGRQSGETCVIEDCVGPSYCNSGTGTCT